jgi:hypothetical protein
VTRPPRDWYRRTTWSASDEQDFLARLKRARRKAQYLVLQASALIDTGDRKLAAVGLQLIDRMLNEHPDAFFLSNAHLRRAEALVRLGRSEDAVFAFRDALAARRALPNVINYAYIEFAWTVARLGLRPSFDEVLAALEEFRQPDDLSFPVNAYRYAGALAFIMADRGDPTAARNQARLALKAIADETGPFSRHPDFGVVDPSRIDPAAHHRLRSLAAE